MNSKMLWLENKKQKGSKELLVFIALMIISLAVISVTLFSSSFRAEMNESQFAWGKLISSFIFIKVILLPIFIASVVAQSTELEDAHDMWKIIKSSGVSLKKIYYVKFLYIMIKLTGYQCIEYLALVIFITSGGLEQTAPYVMLVSIFISQLLISFFLAAIHFAVSLKWENQLINTALAILGGLSGIICLLLPELASHLNPYSWVGRLMPLGYSITKDTSLPYFIPFDPSMALLSLILGSILLFLASRIMRGK